MTKQELISDLMDMYYEFDNPKDAVRHAANLLLVYIDDPEITSWFNNLKG